MAPLGTPVPTNLARRAVPLLVLGVILTAAATWLLTRTNDVPIKVEIVSAETPADIFVDIPSGYGAEQPSLRQPLLAEELVVSVGEVIRIVNNDRQTHFVGPYVIAAGETIQHRFVRPGTLTSNCSVHPSGKLTLTVNR